MGLHKNVPAGDVHVVYSWAFGTEAIRLSFTGAASGDIGKIAWQQDNNTFWVLVDNSPMVWVELTNTTASLAVLTDTTPASVAVAGAVGVATLAARGDHVHAHGAQSNEGLHALATQAAHGFLSASDKLKLDNNAAGRLVQSAFASVGIDTTTTSETFVDLLTVTLTTQANGIITVEAAVNASAANTQRDLYFRLVIDDVPKIGAASRYIAAPSISASLQWRQTGLTAGAHVVKLQWHVVSTTGQIRPVTNGDKECASLLVHEVSA